MQTLCKPVFTSSKSTMGTWEQCMNSAVVLVYLLLTKNLTRSSVSTDSFE